MKKLIVLFLLCLCILCGCGGKEPQTTPIGEFTTTDLSSHPADQRIFTQAELTMVNIWGTFCKPCIGEMPDLAALDDEFGDRLQVVGIVVDLTDKNGNILPEQMAKAIQTVQQTGADYLHLLPSPSLQEACLKEVTAVPVTFFVDREGNRVGDIYIGAKEKDQWQRILQKLLDP